MPPFHYKINNNYLLGFFKVKNVSAGTQDVPPPPSDYAERVDSPMAYSSNGKVNDKRFYPESSYKSTP